MPKRILIIQGHPDSSEPHLCHALAQACTAGAVAAGHEVQAVNVARLDFPVLRAARDWKDHTVPPGLQGAQAAITWAQHLVIFFPLWRGRCGGSPRRHLEHQTRRRAMRIQLAVGPDDARFGGGQLPAAVDDGADGAQRAGLH